MSQPGLFARGGELLMDMAGPAPGPEGTPVQPGHTDATVALPDTPAIIASEAASVTTSQGSGTPTLITQDRLQELVDAGATVQYFSADSVCTAILRSQARKVPKGTTTESRLEQLYAQLFDPAERRRKNAYQTLAGYVGSLGILTSQAGRYYDLGRTRFGKSRRILIQQSDGSFLGIRTQRHSKKNGKSDMLLEDIVAQHKPWDTRDMRPYTELIAQTKRLKRRNPSNLSPPDSYNWRQPLIPAYTLTEEADSYDLTSATDWRLKNHPGVIRTEAKGTRGSELHTIPTGLTEKGWAADGEVTQHMIRLGGVAQAFSQLMRWKHQKKQLMRAFINRDILQAAAFETVEHGGPMAADPVDPAKIDRKDQIELIMRTLREYAQADDLTIEQRYNTSVLIAGLRITGLCKGLPSKQAKEATALLADLRSSQGVRGRDSRAEIKAAKSYAKIVEGHLGMRRSTRSATMYDTIKAFNSNRGLDMVRFELKRR